MKLLELTQSLMAARQGGPALRAADWQDVVKDEADAYAVQDAIAATWADAGPPRAWKSGGAGRAGPFSHAPLDPTGVGAAPMASARWPLLGVEAEIALRLGREVSPEQAQTLVPEQAGDWVDAMAISAELVASRWAEGLAAPELLRMADHQSHAALVLGPWQTWQPLDWARLRWRLTQPDQPTIERAGGHSLADPAWLLPAWLRHVTRHGQTVPVGTVVTTGSWGGLHALGRGEVRLSFEGLGELKFSATTV